MEKKSDGSKCSSIVNDLIPLDLKKIHHYSSNHLIYLSTNFYLFSFPSSSHRNKSHITSTYGEQKSGPAPNVDGTRMIKPNRSEKSHQPCSGGYYLEWKAADKKG